MRFCIIILLFALAGCNEVALINSNSKIVRATCYMEDFKDFPEKVTGPVTLELKNFLTIKIDNEDKSESVEMTFPKSKCKAN